MRKIICVFVLATAFILTACTETAASVENEADIVLTDTYFVRQMFDIVLNHREYLGSTVQFEGLFENIQGMTRDFYKVFRYQRCCGVARLGLEVILDGIEPFEDDTWVKVTGILERNDDRLVIRATSLIEMGERGQIYVFS